MVLVLGVSASVFIGYCDESYPAGDGVLDPYAQNRALGKGVNFGNLLDASPNEGSWTGGFVTQESHFDLAKSAGFDSIRIPIRFSAHALKRSPYTLDEEFMQRVDRIVGWGLARGFRIVIDMHHYEEIHQSPGSHRKRFIAIWEQIAARYRSYPDGVYYEILNEPYGGLTTSVWNKMVEECLRAIRRIDNHHTVIVGCNDWSNPSGLSGLKLPEEETNAIVTFHYYTPHLFSFQGLPWMGKDWATKGISWPGPPQTPVKPAPEAGEWVRNWIRDYNTVTDPELNPAGPGVIRREIAKAAAWGRENRRPLWMSEFTAQDGADMASRANWIRFVRQELESQGIPWSIWTLCSDEHSFIYDRKTGEWILPLTEALGLNVQG